MGLRPTNGDESAFVRFIDSKQVTRDFRRSVIAMLRQNVARASRPAEPISNSSQKFTCPLSEIY